MLTNSLSSDAARCRNVLGTPIVPKEVKKLWNYNSTTSLDLHCRHAVLKSLSICNIPKTGGHNYYLQKQLPNCYGYKICFEGHSLSNGLLIYEFEFNTCTSPRFQIIVCFVQIFVTTPTKQNNTRVSYFVELLTTISFAKFVCTILCEYTKPCTCEAGSGVL